MKNLLWVFALASVATATFTPFLKTELEWKYIDFVWKSQAQKEWFIETGQYDPASIIPIDVDRSNDGRTFITTIRMTGVPASLSTVSTAYNQESGYLLKPYPDWSWYEPTIACKGIVSVYRVAIDECNRMWVLDTGVINANHLCPAKLLAFDLSNDKLVYGKEFGDDVARNRSGIGLLVTPIVKIDGHNCNDFTVYIADVQGYGMLIIKNNAVVRINGKHFEAEMENSDFHIAGDSFHLEDGVLGMALLPKLNQKAKSYLFFRPLASRSLYYTDTQGLKNSFKSHTIHVKTATDVFPSQVPAMAFSSKGTLFYVPTTQLSIGCWNVLHPMQSQYFNTVLRDAERLQFVSGLKIKRLPYHPHKEYALMLSDRYQRMASQNMNLTEFNFRVLLFPVDGINCHNFDSLVST